MPKEKIVMPKLGESVTEGTINTWLVKPGDQVAKYDPIADVMTDKVNAEVPSSHAGTIQELVVEEGETVNVGELICYIETDAVETNEKEVFKDVEESPSHNETATQDESTPMKNRFSPAVLKLSQEHNIDLSNVQGTGMGGRITRKDVKNYINDSSEKARFGKQQTKTVSNSKAHETEMSNGDRAYQLTGIRKTIADNMIHSKQEIPHAWMTVEVDVTDLVNYRNKIKETFRQREGFNLTYFSFFVHALAKTLKEYPVFNSVWSGDQIVQKKDVNISIAVAKGEELFVPVIKQADHLSLTGIAQEINRLSTKGRNGKLTAQDITDGTFTLNNTGSFGSISSMGIINFPQVAILQVESIVKRPVIIDDMFAARDIVNLSLSLDHRVLDGLICGKFMARMKELLEGINENTFRM